MTLVQLKLNRAVADFLEVLRHFRRGGSPLWRSSQIPQSNEVRHYDVDICYAMSNP